MRIRFETQGGIAFFPGLSGSVVFDTDELPKVEGVELERRVEEARFFELPPEVGEPQPGAADYRRYALTVKRGGRSHTVRLADPIEDPGLRALVEALDARAKTSRRVAREGGADETTEE